MSIAAALAALAVFVLRLFLDKVPRALTGLLWAVVFFRMLCPVSFTSPVSLIPQAVSNGTAAQWVLFSAPGDSARQEITPSSPAPSQETALTPSAEAPAIRPEASPAAEPTPPRWPVAVFSVWAAGTAGMAGWAAVSYGRLRHRVREAIRVDSMVYQSDQINSPFVLGFVRPRIYLPLGLDEPDRQYVLLHEQAHISRRDYLTKPLFYLALCIHWFNPILWTAYRLFCLDVETACDQAVTHTLGQQDTAGYAAALLHLGREAGLPKAIPVAFGEEDAKDRIESVLSYKRPVFWVVLLAAGVCLLGAFCLLSNQEDQGERIGRHVISAGSIVYDQKTIPLPEELRRELVSILDDTHHSFYTACEDPGLPEETIVLSHPDSSTEYRLMLTGPGSPGWCGSSTAATRSPITPQPWMGPSTPQTNSSKRRWAAGPTGAPIWTG